MLTQATWIHHGQGDLRQLRYLWDDNRLDEDFTGDASSVLSAAMRMAPRARMALAVALYEWVLWRLDGLHQRDEPLQMLHAAWCATVDPRYLAFCEFEREDWIGPVEGPLWCAMTYLLHGLPQGHVLEGDLLDALAFLYLLAEHIAPDRAPLHQWRDAILPRLIQLHPVRDTDPFEDLFDHRIGETLGPLIGRDSFDPALPVDPQRDRRFLADLLAEQTQVGNPFLNSPEDLEELDFEGQPYVLPA